VHRFASALLVGLLAFNASGVISLIVSEPCTGYELPGQDDGGCPPTCVTCGCCAQSIEPVAMPEAGAQARPVADVTAVPPAPLDLDPRDILHVPKPLLA
jgi:hypothetical protein